MPNLKAACIGLLTITSTAATAGEYMRITTDQGVVTAQLFGHSSAAPVTVQRMRDIVANGEWDAGKNAMFHRAVNNFILQGGAFGIDETSTPKKYDTNDTWSNIINEPGDFANGVRSNIYSTLAMAKLGNDQNSATNQFFFNANNNAGNLDGQNGGFTVFASVVEGMDIVESINGRTTKSFANKDFAPEFATLTTQYYEDIEGRNAYKKHFRDNFTRNATEKYFETAGWYNDFPSDTITRFYYGEDPMAADSFDFSAVGSTPNEFKWDVEIVDLLNTPLTDAPMSPTYDGDDNNLTASDFSTFSVEIYTTLDGDTDGDGDVDLQDLMNVRNNFNGHNLGDANGDSLVNQLDLDMVLANFGQSAPAVVTTIPEPTSLALLLVATTAILKRKK